MIDGVARMTQGNDSLAGNDADGWRAHFARVQAAADTFR
jgi:hypothetical protein